MAESHLTHPHGSPSTAPEYRLWATRDTLDTLTPILADKEASHGINFSGFKTGLVQAIARDADGDPGGTSTIVLTEYEWSEGAEAFIATGVTRTAGGAGNPQAFRFETYGRIMYFAVTALEDGESVSIYVSGFESTN